MVKLTPTVLATIKSKLPNKTKKQKEVKKNFYIDETERNMLQELKDLLDMFEWVTDELQTNDVSISRVYPCFNYLRKGLSKAGTYIYTSQLRKDLLNSLEHRFKDVEENEAYSFSTYLDPVFG